MRPDRPESPPCGVAAARIAVTTVPFDRDARRPGERSVAVETPVNLVYGRVPYAVMMMTPADFDDFAIGFSLTEGVIAYREEIRSITVENDPNGLRLLVDLTPARLHRMLSRRRAMRGRTSCGVCGIEDLADLPRTPRSPVVPTTIGVEAIRRALGALSDHQVLNNATRAVHAAAWAGADGGITCVREDVGRHNALDKLIGALANAGSDARSGFVLITSRCSYEMVEKTAVFGAGVLVAISAPTSLGIERAQQHGIALVGIARPDGITVFSHSERIVVQEAILA